MGEEIVALSKPPKVNRSVNLTKGEKKNGGGGVSKIM